MKFGLINYIMGMISKVKNRKIMLVLYFACVMIPILITDVFVLSSLYRAERTAREHILENEANAIHYTFFNKVDEAAKLGNAFYTSLYVNRFLNHKYDSNLDFYTAYQELFKNSLVNQMNAQLGLGFRCYLDNDSITSGASIQHIDNCKNEDWYQYMIQNNLNKGLYFGITKKPNGPVQRSMLYFQRLNYFDNKSKNVLLIDFDYGKITQHLENLNYESKAYICDRDRILMTNGKYSNINKYYLNYKSHGIPTYKLDMLVYGQELSIIVEDSDNITKNVVIKKWYILVPLIVVNILFPMCTMIQVLSIFYRNKLREQEMVVAQKNAELLALHSQINPHFLFNALDSIRMHSLLKNENETSEMVERLAKLQRQYTEWQDGMIPLIKEMEFVKAYLELQKYRFGDRLSFEIDIDEECEKLIIPKLTVVTFVENACVHGIETKTSPGWIFVRASIKDENMTLEIEDTGNGMEDDERAALLSKMRNANINMLKVKGRVGIINACLRLKMLADDKVDFELDSEIGIGTLVQMNIPIKYLKGQI